MEENNCSYLSSRGIIKSCKYRDIFIQSSCPTISKMVKINDNTKNVIYVCNTALPFFIRNALPTINFRYILVSGDSDTDIPINFNNKLFEYFVTDKRLIHWYCQNYNPKIYNNFDKITQIPIGLDYHTMSYNSTNWGTQIKPIKQEILLKEIKKNSLPFSERIIKCYSNFHFSLNGIHCYDRREALNLIDKSLVFYEENQIQRKETWINQSKYAFVLSPHGNGLDCHRTWEALCLGCIPIVKTSCLDKLYDDLPVLIVNKWNDINEILLGQTILDYQTKKFNYDKLNLKYWVDKIYNTL
jgi:hypothetical protein